MNLVCISEAMLLSMQLHLAAANVAAFCSHMPHVFVRQEKLLLQKQKKKQPRCTESTAAVKRQRAAVGSIPFCPDFKIT